MPEITVHVLRHSHASWIINNSDCSDLEKIIMIAERFGHKDIKETLNTYGHMFPGKDFVLANQLNDLAKSFLSKGATAGYTVTVKIWLLGGKL